MAAKVETIQRIKAILQASLKIDQAVDLPDDMPLVGGEYDLDSLDILLVITSIEKDFGVKIREGTMDRKAFTTVRTLAEYVEQLEPVS